MRAREWSKVKACRAGLTGSRSAQIPEDAVTPCAPLESERRAGLWLRGFWLSSGLGVQREGNDELTCGLSAGASDTA